MIKTTEAVRREVVVDVSPDRAFELFTADMTAWWPAAHHIGSAPIAEIVVEPRAGGRWFTRHEDGTESERLQTFRDVRDAISAAVSGWVNDLERLVVI